MSKKDIFICILIAIFLFTCQGEYQLEANKASIFRSDLRNGPIIAPHRRKMTFKDKTINFDECGIQYTYSDSMLDEIIEIYNDITFGKGHKTRCRHIRGEKLYVKIHFGKLNSKHIPEGFKTEYEKYELKVETPRNVEISADFYPGIVRALDTLSQLIEQTTDENDYQYDIKYAPINITDYPEYAYRGLMIDSAREYFFPDVLKMTIDGMMLGRNNAFHWHFAEDDSIPMFSKSFPDLVNYTAYSDREIYTPEDVKSIVRYAKIRGVKVVPEMEGPSHLHILGFYPEFKGLVGCFRNYTSTSARHGGPPYAPVNPADERTYTFLEGYLKDLSELFESDYWHLGGDEVSIGCVSGLAPTNDFLREHSLNLNQLQDYYIERERNILRDLRPDIKAGYWWRGNKNNYGKGDILQYWGGGGSIAGAMKSHPDNYFIYAPSGVYYLDCGYVNQYFGGSWCGGIHSWKDIYHVDPRRLHDKDQKDRFLGGELPLWSEMNNEYNLPLKLFPRGGAMGFRLWSPEGPTKEVEVMEMMVKYQNRLKNYDIPSSRVTQRYCEENIHDCFGK